MKRILWISLILVVLLSACGAAPRSMSYEASAPMEEPMVAMESFAEDGSARSFDNSAPSGAGVDAATIERKIIQNANLGIVVADPQDKMDAIQKMTDEMGGFVVSSNTRQTTTRNGQQVPEGDITVRVPAEKLDAALDFIKADAVEVQFEERSGQDVTSQYVDLQSRLRTHEDAAEQLSKILEQKTESSEVIEVFNQLVYHREQIELIKGQMKYIDEAAAYSAISVNIVAEETLQPIEIAGWKPVGVARDALQTLINFLQGFVDFLIWLFILFIPAGLLILGALWLVWKVFRWAWNKLFLGKKKKETPPEETKE